jgi:hypothetical protein
LFLRIFFLLIPIYSEPPFTFQRLAELALDPAPYYSSSLPKYIRALVRCLSVSSSVSTFPRVEAEEVDDEDVEMAVDGGEDVSTGTSAIVEGEEPTPAAGAVNGRRRSRSGSVSSEQSGGSRTRRKSRSRSAERGTMPLLSPIPFISQRGSSPPLSAAAASSLGEPEDLALSSSSPPPSSLHSTTTADLPPPTSPRPKDTLPLDGLPSGPVDELDVPAESRSFGLVRDGKGTLETADEPVPITSAAGGMTRSAADGGGGGGGGTTTTGLGLALEDRSVAVDGSAKTGDTATQGDLRQ